MQNNKKQNESRFGTLLRKIERKLSGYAKNVTIPEREKISTYISESETDEIEEVVREAQYQINNEIKFRAHQPIGAITRFERNNLVVSLTENEEQHSAEIFEPFVSKGYTVTDLTEYDPFAEYHVHLVSWK